MTTNLRHELRLAELSLNNVALTYALDEFIQSYDKMADNAAWAARFSGWLCATLESGSLNENDTEVLLALLDEMMDWTSTHDPSA